MWEAVLHHEGRIKIENETWSFEAGQNITFTLKMETAGSSETSWST
jgi:hypothetical protein